MAALTEQFVQLSLDEDRNKVLPPTPPSNTAHTPAHSVSSSRPHPYKLQHSRAGSSSSIASILYSEPGTPSRLPQRSSLRRQGSVAGHSRSNSVSLAVEIDTLQSQLVLLDEKIFQIEELRHSLAREEHTAYLNTLLSEFNETVERLAPRFEALEVVSLTDAQAASLRTEWVKVTAKHALLKQEVQEDPWLIRFRTTADQADAMMDPLQSSLMEMTSYVVRITEALVPVPMTAPGDRLSIERLQSMLAAHGRLKDTYVPSVRQILNMMERNVSGRAVKNGEAIRRLNDMKQRWKDLQAQLHHLDIKSRLLLSQNDPDSPDPMDHVEMLTDDDGGPVFLMSPNSHASPPRLDLPLHSQTPLTRVLSASSASSSSLAPPNQQKRTGSVTPSAQRTLRKSMSRPSLSSSASYTASDGRPRWNASTRPMPPRPSPPPTPPPLLRRASHNAVGLAGMQTPTIRRTSSPALSTSSPVNMSRIPQRAPRKSMPATPLSGRATPGGHGTPHRSALSSSVGRPPLPPSSFRSNTPGPSHLSRRPNTPAATPHRPRHSATPGPGHTPRHSTTPGPGHTPRYTNTPGPGHHPLPPPRPSSRLSMSSACSGSYPSAPLKPFEPSKYDLLDQEVQRLLDAIQPAILIMRLDPPLRRGQRKADGEWTGEFIFGAGERSTPVRLLELANKRNKPMVRIGGAWQDLSAYLRKKKAEAESAAEDF